MRERALERLRRDLRTGLITLAVLKILVEKGPMHGYALRRILTDIIGEEPAESTVYDALKRLERLGLAKGFWSRSSMGTIRKYYEASPEARNVLNILVDEVRKLLSWVICDDK